MAHSFKIQILFYLRRTLCSLSGGWTASSSVLCSICLFQHRNKNIVSTISFALPGSLEYIIPVVLCGTSLSFHQFCVKLETDLFLRINWSSTIERLRVAVRELEVICTLEKFFITYSIADLPRIPSPHISAFWPFPSCACLRWIFLNWGMLFEKDMKITVAVHLVAENICWSYIIRSQVFCCSNLFCELFKVDWSRTQLRTVTLHYISSFQTPLTPWVTSGASTDTCYTKYSSLAQHAG